MSQQVDSNKQPGPNVKLEKIGPTEIHGSSYSTKNQSAQFSHFLKLENEEAISTNDNDSSNNNLGIVSDETSDSQSDTSEPRVNEISLELEEIELQLTKKKNSLLSKSDLKSKRSQECIRAIRRMNRIIKKSTSVSSTTGQIYPIKTIKPKDSGIYTIGCLVCKKFCLKKTASKNFLETLYFWHCNLKSSHPRRQNESMLRHFEEEHPNISRNKRLEVCEVKLIDTLKTNQKEGTKFSSLNQLQI